MRADVKAVILAILCIVAIWVKPAKADVAMLPAVVIQSGETAPDAVVGLERVTLGGVAQTILIRGARADLPVLLFLHGGPGGSVMPWVELFHTPLLEENFIVVHWDQRGTGASFSPDLQPEDISASHLVSDTLELTDLLRNRFGQDRIFLAGHSWGSALGFLTIAEEAAPFHAFIAISERVDWDRSLQIGYDWARGQAMAAGDAKLLGQLDAIAPFDAFDAADLAVQRQAIDHFGGGDFYVDGLWDHYLSYVLDGQSPYYTAAQIENYGPGLDLSAAAIEKTDLLASYDLFSILPRIDIPVHFITGTEDRNTPAELAYAYFDALEAPGKSFTRIEGAAHMVMFEKPLDWADAMVAIKAQTLRRN